MSIKYVGIFVVVILLTLAQAKVMKASKIVKAINCGLKQGFTRADDIKYENDANLVSGKSVDVDYHSDSGASATDIRYAIDKEIYMFERHTYSEMTYSLPVKNGAHTIILKFAQMYFEKPGQRVFNIKIGKTVVVENMDVIAKTGHKYAAHEQYIEINVKSGEVTYKGIVIQGAIQKGSLQLTFSKGKADNPIIQAIIVFQGPLSESSKEDYDLMKKDWGSHQELLKARKENEAVKERLQTIKKKEKVVIRNDQLLIEEEQEENSQAGKGQKFGMIRSFLMSPIGILVWAAIFVWKIVFIWNKVFQLGRSENTTTKTEKEKTD